MVLFRLAVFTVFFLGIFFPTRAAISAEPGEVARNHISKANAAYWFALSEATGPGNIERGIQALDIAQRQLDSLKKSDPEHSLLAAQINALRSDLTAYEKSSRDSFYSVFPLVRTTVPFALFALGDNITETSLREPELAATRRAARKIVTEIIRFDHPHVVVRAHRRDDRFCRKLFVLICDLYPDDQSYRFRTQRFRDLFQGQPLS